MADNKKGQFTEDQIHHGENIRRLRALLDVKQELLAFHLGNGWSQKRISLIEARKVLPIKIISEVAAGLQITPDLITGSTTASFVNAVRMSSQAAMDHERMKALADSNAGLFAPIAELLQEQNQLFKFLLDQEKQKLSVIVKFLNAKKVEEIEV